jgi:hypothetical protein
MTFTVADGSSGSSDASLAHNLHYKRKVDLPHLRASFRALARPRYSSRCTPLLGFARFKPSRRHSVDRPLPGVQLESSSPFGTSLPRDVSCSALVVSHHLDGLLRSRGPCLHRVPDKGSPRFARPQPPPLGRRSAPLFALSQCLLPDSPRPQSGSPQRGSYPSKNTTHPQPESRHRDPLPSCRSLDRLASSQLPVPLRAVRPRLQGLAPPMRGPLAACRCQPPRSVVLPGLSSPPRHSSLLPTPASCRR